MGKQTGGTPVPPVAHAWIPKAVGFDWLVGPASRRSFSIKNRKQTGRTPVPPVAHAWDTQIGGCQGVCGPLLSRAGLFIPASAELELVPISYSGMPYTMSLGVNSQLRLGLGPLTHFRRVTGVLAQVCSTSTPSSLPSP